MHPLADYMRLPARFVLSGNLDVSPIPTTVFSDSLSHHVRRVEHVNGSIHKGSRFLIKSSASSATRKDSESLCEGG